jgi:hypothetical protein
MALPGNKAALVDVQYVVYNADARHCVLFAAKPGAQIDMEKEFIDRAKAIREGILQLRDSL